MIIVAQSKINYQKVDSLVALFYPIIPSSIKVKASV